MYRYVVSRRSPTLPTENSDKDSAPEERVNVAAQALAPDLEAIRRFIVGMIARGAIAELVASVLALLQRMREITPS